MTPEHLRLIAFCVYLAACGVFAAGAIISALPRAGAETVSVVNIASIVGALLQSVSPIPIALSIDDSPLRPSSVELIATITLAPLGAAIFGWTLWTVRRSGSGLITNGAFGFVRHPMYLAFLTMLLATGFVASAAIRLVPSVLIYIAGSELRIATEETELEGKFPSAYAQYRRATRWRYIPGLR